jgi:hypothetical protein
MKHKFLKLNAVLLLGLSLSSLQAQTTMNVMATNGTHTAYTLGDIRKLTFPSTGNMTVTKTTATTDNYVLTAVRNMNFSIIDTNIESINPLRGFHRLYPNPVHDVLNIDLSTSISQHTTLELLSIEGKLLFKSSISSTENRINVSQFRQGIYLCRINNGTTLETTKFIKQ